MIKQFFSHQQRVAGYWSLGVSIDHLLMRRKMFIHPQIPFVVTRNQRPTTSSFTPKYPQTPIQITDFSWQ
jgi:hypothetical protein